MSNVIIDRIFWDNASQKEYSSGDNYDLYLVLSGAAIFRCGNANLSATSDTLIIFKPNEKGILLFQEGPAPLEVMRVSLSIEGLKTLSDDKTDLVAAFDIVPFKQIAVHPDREIYMLLKNLARKLYSLSCEQGRFGAEIFEKGILQMFVVLVVRACIQAENHKSKASRHHMMLDEIFLYIQAHLDEEITLQQLEEHFYISHEHIAREFKKQTGQTIHAFIVKSKLDRCCRLIEQGFPITEVYMTAGFGGYNHFFRAFKKEYGMTPKQYYQTTKEEARG